LALLASVSNYYEVTKPKIWYLLVFTAVASFVVASGRNISPFLAVATTVAVLLGSAGANTITSYFDRDIDAVMNRTKLRPIPTKRIYPAVKAYYYGLVLAGLSVAISFLINPVVFALMLFGIIDNVVIYSKILKRRSPVNIILGGFSGGAPAAIGYTAVTGTIDSVALIMAALVVLWIPTHIWSLALHSKADYAKVDVPMLPVVVSERVAVRCIGSTTILMLAASIIPFFLELGPGFGPLYLAVAILFGVVMFALNLWLIAKPTADRAWRVFKFSSPYLAVLFVAMMVDSLLA
jgi:protoheme IX farnesyltransferase